MNASLCPATDLPRAIAGLLRAVAGLPTEPRFRCQIGCLLMCTISLGHLATAQQPRAGDEVSQQDVLQGTALTPRAVRIAAKSVEPALVTIESFGGVSTTAGRIGGIRQQGEGNTTGVMIAPDGYIVTSSFNFIEQPPVITVITSDGVRRVATLLGRDDTRRICLLKVNDVKDMPVLEFVSPDEIEVGQWAISVGVGYGDKNPAISMGIVSAKGRFAGRAIQTDANISPANYGGPLLDIEGRMMGVCVPMSPGSQSLGSGVEWYDSGIGFAIPLHDSESLIERLKNGEHIQRGFLGIRSENAENEQGIKVAQVVSGTAAEKAELKEGDVITALDEHHIKSVMDLRIVLAQYNAGDEVTLTLVRGDESITKNITLGAPPKPEDEDTPSMFPGRRRTPDRDR